jgi:hypothetical protein
MPRRAVDSSCKPAAPCGTAIRRVLACGRFAAVIPCREGARQTARALLDLRRVPRSGWTRARHTAPNPLPARDDREIKLRLGERPPQLDRRAALLSSRVVSPAARPIVAGRTATPTSSSNLRHIMAPYQIWPLTKL